MSRSSIRFDPGNRLIAALDVPTRAEADQLVEAIGPAASWLKIGLELFISAGPDIVRDYSGNNSGNNSDNTHDNTHGNETAKRHIMLDLKLHDIPTTVGRATRQAAELGAQLLTIHAGGGRKMMEAAANAARLGGDDRIRILAVTVLTSMSDSDMAAVGGGESVERMVLRRTQLALEAGCDGVVCSPNEAALIRQGCPDDFLIVTPGVRPHHPTSNASSDDQARIATPKQARANGADLIVVGRPIRDADSPGAVAAAIAAELSAA